jgi:hypothetical protein
MVKFYIYKIKNCHIYNSFYCAYSPATGAETKVKQVLDKILETHRQYSAGKVCFNQREILTRSMSMLDMNGH